jgi:hypothetical protein
MSGVVGSDIGNVLSYQLLVFSKARARLFLGIERIAEMRWCASAWFVSLAWGGMTEREKQGSKEAKKEAR